MVLVSSKIGRDKLFKIVWNGTFTMIEPGNAIYKDVTEYPGKFLQIDRDQIHIPVTYKNSWDDGFGARGWKVNVTIGDPQIIASTRETGPRIHTSVFVHDILDHFLSGFGVSGHRSEAMALIQLSKRTNSSPAPDYKQIIEEDLLSGRVNGESMQSFLPSSLTELLPDNVTMTDKEIILFFKNKLGVESLSDRLVDHFFTLGKAGEKHSENNWMKLGLDHHKQKAIGDALQRLLVEVDSKAEAINIEEIKGIITIDSHQVSFDDQNNSNVKPIGAYQENY